MYLYLDANGLFGVALTVAAGIVVAFVLFGAGGIGVAAAMALLTREPERKGAAIPASAKGVAGKAELQWLWANRGVTLPLYLAFAICFTFSSSTWSRLTQFSGRATPRSETEDRVGEESASTDSM